MPPPSGQTYTQILKSTMLMGGSSLVNVLLSIIRNKAFAVLLGPDGVGLIGLYGAIIDIAQATAGLGVSSSGVRRVAQAATANDPRRIARSVTALRRISVVLGLLGTLLVAALAFPISQFTFGDHQHAGIVAVLSLAVFFKLVYSGQTGMIQGFRGIADLARINVLAGVFGTTIAIPMVYMFGTQAIAPSLVAVAAVSLLPSWWYSRATFVNREPLTLRDLRPEVAALLRLGLAFMASGLLTFGAAYGIRVIVLDQGGVNAAGLYQAAWALGGLYAGFILQAMGTDFYPRLTASAHDNAECNRLVNEQAEISVLLAGPGLLATLTLAPFLMSWFYSAQFHTAADLLRWICLGMMLRLVAWPMGFIVVAKGAQTIFFWTEVAATVVHVGLAWLLVARLGALGAGVAFFCLYVWHTILIYLIVRRLTGFRWSPANCRHALVFLPASIGVFAAFFVLSPWSATVIGSVAVVISGLYSLRILIELLRPGAMLAITKGWSRKPA